MDRMGASISPPARQFTSAREIGPALGPASVRARLDLPGGRRGYRAGYLDAGSGETVTWSEAARQGAEWALQLPPGTVVGLRAARPAAFCRAYLARLHAGGRVAPPHPLAHP